LAAAAAANSQHAFSTASLVRNEHAGDGEHSDPCRQIQQSMALPLPYPQEGLSGSPSEQAHWERQHQTSGLSGNERPDPRHQIQPTTRTWCNKVQVSMDVAFKCICSMFPSDAKD